MGEGEGEGEGEGKGEGGGEGNDESKESNTVRTDALFECDRDFNGAPYDVRVERGDRYSMRIVAEGAAKPFKTFTVDVPPDQLKELAASAATRPRSQQDLAELLARDVQLRTRDGEEELTLTAEPEGAEQ